MFKPLTSRDFNKTGVYCWKNSINGLFYVGSAASSFRVRRNLHLSDLRNSKHRNEYFQRAWDKYGEKSFQFLILTICLKDNCIKWEQHWMDKLNSYNRNSGYNLSPTAGNTLGFHHSEESKLRMSLKHKGKILSKEHVANIKIASTGRKHSQQAKDKISNALKGRVISLEARRRMSVSARNRRK